MTRIESSGVIRFLFIGLAASLAAGATLFYRIFAPNCDSTLIAEFPAPHRPIKASVSVRKCRVSQVFSSQVSVLHADQRQLPDSPNVASVQGWTLEGRAVGAPEIAVIWTSDSSLVVRYDTTRPAVRSTGHPSGVTIHFESLR